MKGLLLGLALLLAWCPTTEFVAAQEDDGVATGSEDGDEGTEAEEVALDYPSCGTCHSRRERLFQEGVHGDQGLECLDCHGQAEEHASSFGQVTAPHPRNYLPAEANALCTSCHSLEDDAFVCVPRMKTSETCIECHSFHELTHALENPPEAINHGVPVEIRWTDPKEFFVSGAFEVGVRAVSGNDRQFRDNVNLEPGVQLVQAHIEGSTTDQDRAYDHFQARVRGLGDPHATMSASLQKSGEWEIDFAASQHQDIYDATTELHEASAERLRASATVTYMYDTYTELQFGYERFRREDTRVLSRYRDISNQRYAPTNGDRVEDADLAWVRHVGAIGDWDVSVRQSARWWREDDERVFLAANAPINDFEDSDDRTTVFTPTTDFTAVRSFMDEQLVVDVEGIFALSEKRFDIDSASTGVDSGGDDFSAILASRGDAQSRYARLEVGAIYEVDEDTAWEFRVRYRNSRDEASIDGTETVTLITLATTTVTPIDVDSREDHDTVDLELLVQKQLNKDTRVHVGYGGRYERIKVRGPFATSEHPSTFGLITEIESDVREDLKLEAFVHAYTTQDPYTRISVDDRAQGRVAMTYKPHARLWAKASYAQTRDRLQASSGSRADLDVTDLWLTWTSPKEMLTTRVGATYTDQETDVDTIAQISGFPVPYEARFTGHGWVWSFTADTGMLGSWQLFTGAHFADFRGEVAYRKVHSYLTGAYNVGSSAWWRGSLRFYWFDDLDGSTDDFESTVFELSYEQRF